jgi:hypothetical protein
LLDLVVVGVVEILLEEIKVVMEERAEEPAERREAGTMHRREHLVERVHIQQVQEVVEAEIKTLARMDLDRVLIIVWLVVVQGQTEEAGVVDIMVVALAAVTPERYLSQREVVVVEALTSTRRV